MRKLIIGADGGASKTNLIAVDALTQGVVCRASAPGINCFDVGLNVALGHLLDGIRNLNLAPEDRILAVSLGDPTLDDSDPEEGGALRLALREALQVPVFSKSDVFMALYAVTRGEAGALIAAGTGSMGIALTEPYRHGADNAILTVGGWGIPASDGGSGYSIAVHAITAAFDAFDRIAPSTLLCQAVQRHFGAQSPRELIGIFNTEPLSRSRIASFAREVDRCACVGDAVSERILERAGEKLGRYARSLLRNISAEEKVLGICGSVLTQNKRVLDAMKRTVAEEFPGAVISLPDFPPEWGAALYAFHALGGTV